MLYFFVLLLTLAATIGCEKTRTIPGTSPVTAGAFLATLTVTDYSDPAHPQASTYDGVSFWIMQDGTGVSYWGALAKELPDRVVIDSKVENYQDPFIQGLYETYVYSGSATATEGHLSFKTYYYAADGSLIAGPLRVDYDVSNLTGPISLPIASPTPAAFTEAPQPPIKDFSPAGMRAFASAHAPVH